MEPPNFLATGKTATGLPMRLIQGKHAGPAVARNQGVHAARSELILLLQDDTLPIRNDLLSGHLAFHQQLKKATEVCLGFASWDPALRITPFMEFLEQGTQFAYHNIKDTEDVRFGCFYSCNISFKRQFFLDAGAFDEQFRFAALEDTELGHRMKMRGMRMRFRKHLAVHHHHPTTLLDFRTRQWRVGNSLLYFTKRCPGVLRVPEIKESQPPLRWLSKLGKQLEYQLVHLMDQHGVPFQAATYDRLLRYSEHRGLLQAQKDAATFFNT